MARILYGVQADGTGHLNRARSLAEEMPHHEFLFVGGGVVRQLADQGYGVVNVPALYTYYGDNAVNSWKTAWNATKVLACGGPVVTKIAEVIKHFDPDLIITDYEYFTCKAARKMGRPCVTLDNQHAITHCRYDQPAGQYLNSVTTAGLIRLLFPGPERFLVTSFFRLPPKDQRRTEVFPPIIRRPVAAQKPSDGDHVLVYQTSPTFHKLVPILERLRSRFVIYGMNHGASRGNVLFKERSSEGFVQDLASCRYVIANGGHNVICEALYLGKPVLCFPIRQHFEQFMNAYFLDQLGYGAYSLAQVPGPEVFDAFEARIDQLVARIRREDFFGNLALVQRIDQLIASSNCPARSRESSPGETSLKAHCR